MTFERAQTVGERFWSKVDKTGEHWIWTGNVAGGYGQFWMPEQPRPAHVFSWELANGRPVTPGLIIRHRCDIPLCVRPECLLEGTNAQNTRDMLERGRCGTLKYDAELITRVRMMHQAGIRKSVISRETGISDSHVSRICLRQGRVVV